METLRIRQGCRTPYQQRRIQPRKAHKFASSPAAPRCLTL